jgi:hypothetical protein
LLLLDGLLLAVMGAVGMGTAGMGCGGRRQWRCDTGGRCRMPDGGGARVVVYDGNRVVMGPAFRAVRALSLPNRGRARRKTIFQTPIHEKKKMWGRRGIGMVVILGQKKGGRRVVL